MISTQEHLTPSATLPRIDGSRSMLAKSRLAAARAALEHCTICACECGVDRLHGPAGRCGAGDRPRVFSAQIEVGDELELIPTYAIALSGCNMRCAFCITGEDSWDPSRGADVALETLVGRVSRAVDAGRVKTIQILGGEPTVHLSWLVEFVSNLPDHVRLVLKTNGIVTAHTRELLVGLFDVWLVDLKFGNDTCAQALSRTPGYFHAVTDTLSWAEERADLIIRHLVMPGHVECCFGPVTSWIADHLPHARVSLRFGYWPAWKALEIPGLNRAINDREQARALEIAQEHGLHLVP